MSEIRKRKTSASKKEKTQARNGHTSQTQKNDDSREGILTVLSVAAGIISMVAMGYIHAKYMATIHENWMWFSNIKVILNISTYIK